MFVDDTGVEKIHDDWGIIYDELYLEMSEKVANRFLVNRNIGYDRISDMQIPYRQVKRISYTPPLFLFEEICQ